MVMIHVQQEIFFTQKKKCILTFNEINIHWKPSEDNREKHNIYPKVIRKVCLYIAES